MASLRCDANKMNRIIMVRSGCGARAAWVDDDVGVECGRDGIIVGADYVRRFHS